MKEKRSFVTIFTEAENFHLVKDVGQIPYQMHKEGDFNSKLVCYQNEPVYRYLENELKGLDLKFIPNRGKLGPFEIGILHYLFRKAKEIDVLNLFHFRRDHLLYILIYKFFNPAGKVYIKLDLDIRFFKQYNSFFYSKYLLKRKMLRLLAFMTIKKTDLFTIETMEGYAHLKSCYPKLKDKLLYLPNGVDSDGIKLLVKSRSFQEKENIIISVGRIGSYQKNTELLLEALIFAPIKDWKVYILGPQDADFLPYKKKYFDNYPEMAERVFFAGNISDRMEMLDWYDRAKVFCLTSRFEGFPLCFPEALYFGNYIITTPVSGAEDITDNENFGTIAPADAEQYGKAITRTIEEGYLSYKKFEDIMSLSRKKFIWKELIKPLITALK